MERISVNPESQPEARWDELSSPQTRVTDELDFAAGRLKRAAEGVAVGGGGEQRARHVAIAHAYDLQTLGA